MIKFLFIPILIFGIMACDDEIPYELAKPKGGKQKVLIEEISGVRCPNCPDGSRLLEALNEDFDSSLIVVTYHAGSFSNPYKESKYDFKTDQTVALMELLGQPEGYPSAAIQRIGLPDQDTYQRLPNTWTSAISDALGEEPMVDLKGSVDTVSTFTNLNISALFLEDVNKSVYMTAYLVEDGLVDPQADSKSRDEYLPAYVHNHVLREILTPVTGTKWSEGFKALDFKEDVLYVELNSLSNVVDPEKTAFIVFVHTEEGVLQVEKIKAIR